MLSLREKNVVLVVHTSRSPSEAEWEAMMVLLREVSPRELRILAITDGGAPNVNMRHALNDYSRGAEPVIAVVSNSLPVRGVATAISWFNKRIKVFDPAQIDRAFDHVGFAKGERAAWILRAKSLSGELASPAESLAIAAQHVA